MACGLKLDAYEAGEDTYGSLNIAAKQQAVLDPQNAALIQCSSTGADAMTNGRREHCMNMG